MDIVGKIMDSYVAHIRLWGNAPAKLFVGHGDYERLKFELSNSPSVPIKNEQTIKSREKFYGMDIYQTDEDEYVWVGP